MSFTDVMLMVAILALAGWVFYLSFLKKKGACAGCTSSTCGKATTSRRSGQKDLIRLAGVLAGIFFLSSSAYANRPLVTDDAGTVGKGKGQVEIGAQTWHHKEAVNDATTNKSDGGEIAPVITIGLHDQMDLVATIPYQWRSLETNGTRVSRANGIGDAGLDLKWRFFDHDGWGLALKPGISFPTGDESQELGSGRTAYRLFFITSKELGSVACHVNLGYIRSENNTGDNQDLWHASLAAEYEVSKTFKIMGNIGATRNPTSGSGTHPAFALGGLAYLLSERISVDGGIKFGLNKAETDVTYLFGMTFKF